MADHLLQLAENYVAAVLQCRDAASHVKALKDEAGEIGSELLEALEDAEVDAVKTSDGYTVKRFLAKKLEALNDEFLVANLTEFFSRHDKANEAPTTRANNATEFVCAKREAETNYRLSLKKPRAPTKKKTRRDK